MTNPLSRQGLFTANEWVPTTPNNLTVVAAAKRYHREGGDAAWDAFDTEFEAWADHLGLTFAQRGPVRSAIVGAIATI